jgi:CRP/FNR family transcriptional regulator
LHQNKAQNNKPLQKLRKAEILGQIPIFSCLSEAELAELSEITIDVQLRRGNLLWLEGDIPEYFHIVVEGELRVFFSSSTGKEITLTFLGPGKLLGPMAIFQDGHCSASVVATTNAKLLAIKKEGFVSFLCNYPKLYLGMIKVLTSVNAELSRRIRDIAWERVDKRVVRILLILSDRIGPTISISCKELSEMVGTTTESVIRCISYMKKRGIISSTRRKITILEKGKLQMLSEE